MELAIENKELDSLICLHSCWSNTQVEQDLKEQTFELTIIDTLNNYLKNKIYS